ncbi:MAG: hypothetical protein FE78DRAFT_73688 [Acidomyces sp. 'richmondensis']|nr:MAG: hypothetical protein FE78DRAFT_73688 [Acidomyces sp. 'richmondensis']
MVRPFHAQNEHVLYQNSGPSSPGFFVTADMSNVLPRQMQYQRPYHPEAHHMFAPTSVYQIHQATHFPNAQLSHVDVGSLMMNQQQQQQQQSFHPHYFGAGGASQGHPSQQVRSSPHQMQSQFSPHDGHRYSIDASRFPPINANLGSQLFMTGGVMTNDMNEFSRRFSEPLAVPSFPRGPPRKPRQSGHALWVGNLPPGANVADLKDHFSRDATKDIESLFLISKSNCAFVNYRTEAACIAAMNRFHDSRFHGVRLVCRLRRGSNSTSTTSTTRPSASPSLESLADEAEKLAISDGPSEPVIVGRAQEKQGDESSQSGEDQNLRVSDEVARVPDKYFIVKSLTVPDLESSVQNGLWATQSHNEDALNRAYKTADNVYLIFSANKSGEYFGYARMASPIHGDPVNLGTSADIAKKISTVSLPQSIPTPATDTAPSGRIIDDSARGTIFWEADISEDEAHSPKKDHSGDGQNWGRQFKIEWKSTTRLPFFRTRGLRNPWNANREVKIARDGTELEPNVGRRLVQMFHSQRQIPLQDGPSVYPGNMLFNS